MRKNMVQIATLVLCVVLLVLNIRQGRKLEEYKNQLSAEISNKYSMLYNDLEGISARIERKVEEDAELVESYELQPTGLVRSSRSLQADVAVTLKEWQPDTAVTLLARLNGEEQNISMVSAGNGDFTCEVELPVEQDCEIWLDAVVTSGGMTRREELGGWSEVSMLLPVQMHSWGGTAPVYKDGVLSVGHHDGDLEMRDGSPLKVSDTCYRLYVNGEVVIEEPECLDWIYVCAEGDEVRLALFCRDEYGLGYEFTLDEFVCDEDASDRGTGFLTNNGTESPILSWD